MHFFYDFPYAFTSPSFLIFLSLYFMLLVFSSTEEATFAVNNILVLIVETGDFKYYIPIAV